MEGEEDEEEGDDWEYEEVEEEPEVPRREVLGKLFLSIIDFLKSLSHSFVFHWLLQKLAQVQGPYCSKPVIWPVSSNTEQAADILRSWVALMRNRSSNLLV